jgi:hypothetical protein
MSTLANIRTKVRRLTGRPSPQQITDAQIDFYVNTFYLYDMPENLRLFTMETVFEFMTEANVDQYDMNTMQVWTGLDYENAVDIYLTIKPPVYVAGYESQWSQDRAQFFRAYPYLAQISNTLMGNGTGGPYTLTFPNTPVLQFSVTVGAIDATDNAVNVIDVPQNRTSGNWQIINTNIGVTGNINYLTGAATITFATAIPVNNEITFTATPYVANIPLSLLYYDNVITLRPVPDQSYKVQVNAYKRPTVLFDSTQSPQLQQWWQYLAYGASKKVFEESQDNTGLQSIMPGFKEQERLVLRRTIVERTNQRTGTIFTEMTNVPYGNFQNNF